MKKMTREELEVIVEKHHKYQHGKEGGEKGVVAGMDLRGVDLSHLNLRGMVFDRADMRCTRMVCTDLSDTSMRGVNMGGAKVLRTSFHGADLTGANMADMSIKRSDFSESRMIGVNLEDAGCLSLSCFARITGLPIYQVTNLGSFNNSLTLLAVGEDNAKWRWYEGWQITSYSEEGIVWWAEQRPDICDSYLRAITFLKAHAIAEASRYREQPLQQEGTK